MGLLTINIPPYGWVDRDQCIRCILEYLRCTVRDQLLVQYGAVMLNGTKLGRLYMTYGVRTSV